MHSSRADWVLGEARLISSPTTMLAKTPPGRNSNWRVSWLKTETPVTSEGSRSGVNWMRAHRAVDAAGQRLAELGLADAGHVLDEEVALGEQHDQGGVDDVGLARDDALDVLRTAPVTRASVSRSARLPWIRQSSRAAPSPRRAVRPLGHHRMSCAQHTRRSPAHAAVLGGGLSPTVSRATHGPPPRSPTPDLRRARHSPHRRSTAWPAGAPSGARRGADLHRAESTPRERSARRGRGGRRRPTAPRERNSRVQHA